VSAEVLALVDRLSAAFAARDVGAALDCFAADEDIGYAGSEQSETATGRDAVTDLFTRVFARDEAYSWQTTTSTVREYGDHAYVLAEATGLVRADTGELTPFPYRVSGLLHRIGGRWRWRHCLGSEPAVEP
jgi:ketosteroid isomerase-like protein